MNRILLNYHSLFPSYNERFYIVIKPSIQKSLRVFFLLNFAQMGKQSRVSRQTYLSLKLFKNVQSSFCKQTHPNFIENFPVSNPWDKKKRGQFQLTSSRENEVREQETKNLT